MPLVLDVIDLGFMSYAGAFSEQEKHNAQVLAQREVQLRLDKTNRDIGRILFVEHVPPVITVSRRPGANQHLIATAQMLEKAGVEVCATDRGGDITYHGPGQLVAYPILDLNLLNLRLHDYMRLLESVVIDVVASYGLIARRERDATGVWVIDGDLAGESGTAVSPSRKICAMGVRIKRWVTMHGLALNVTTNLDHFNLIVPCGLVGRKVTSLERELGVLRCPQMSDVKQRLGQTLLAHLQQHVDSQSAGTAS